MIENELNARAFKEERTKQKKTLKSKKASEREYNSDLITGRRWKEGKQSSSSLSALIIDFNYIVCLAVTNK